MRLFWELKEPYTVNPAHRMWQCALNKVIYLFFCQTHPSVFLNQNHLKALWWKKSKNKKYSFKDTESPDGWLTGRWIWGNERPVAMGGRESHVSLITSPGSILMASKEVLHNQFAASCSRLSSRSCWVNTAQPAHDSSLLTNVQWLPVL